MNSSNQIKISVTKKVDGKVRRQSASIKNGKISAVEKSIEEPDHAPTEQLGSIRKDKEEDSSSDHPIDVMIEGAYTMTSKMPLAGPYVKLAMDGVHFKWMVHEVADVIFKPFFPMPKIKK